MAITRSPYDHGRQAPHTKPGATSGIAALLSLESRSRAAASLDFNVRLRLRPTTTRGRRTKPLYKDFPRCQAGVLCFSFAKQAVGLAGSSRGRVALKLQCDREQTAHLQTVLLHLSVRTQIRTAQPGSIRATWLGTIAAAYGLSSSPAAGLTCQMHLREHVLGGGNGLGCGVDRWSWLVAVLRPSR